MLLKSLDNEDGQADVLTAEEEQDLKIQKQEETFKSAKTAKAVVKGFDLVVNVVQRKANIGKIKWHDFAETCLFIQLFLSVFASFYRSEFFALTAVAIGMYQVNNIETVRYRDFKRLVLFILFSLVADLIWL